MTWLDQPSTGIEPPFVSAFTFTKIDATRAVVFGGHEHCNNRNYNDVYILDLRTWVCIHCILDTCSEITSLYSNDDSEVIRILSFTTAYIMVVTYV